MTSTLTVRSHDLHLLLKTAILFASKDETLPMLTHIKLERIGDDLVATTTDRFRIGVTRIPLQGNDNIGDLNVLLPVMQAKNLIPVLKVLQRERDTTYTTLEVNGDRRVTLGGHSGLIVKWTHNDSTAGELVDASDVYDFPNWRRLFPADRETIAAAPADRTAFAVNGPLFADFVKAVWAPGDHLTVEPADVTSKPIVVRVGRHFLGLIMPVRTADNSHSGDCPDNRADWSAILGKR